ncbi:Protein F25G6.7 b [Aphelenchoides avenae]|nr:Protein F25G6.7 b [Aphelenchus avenae]
MAAVHPVKDCEKASSEVKLYKPATYRWFPSFRMLTASMLCLCFASVHMMNANLGMAVVCMVNDTSPSIYDDDYSDNEFSEVPRGVDNFTELLLGISEPVDPRAAPKVNWTPEEQGYIFGAFNAGLLCMLLTGFLADKFNAKWMIIVSVLLASAANIMIPLTAEMSVYYAVLARFLVGVAEALLQPAITSLLTRWFPSSERSYALGLATGGRQIGTLLIVPTAGALCAQSSFFGGWPAIFYVSAFTGLFFVLLYFLTGADKPSKQNYISQKELKFITVSNESENVGQKRIDRTVPWKDILTSWPVWAALISVVCHEFPLMTMIMFLPSYLHDVHHYEATKNGILSALPTACLWACTHPVVKLRWSALHQRTPVQ